jgi:hypothetical protein
MMRRARLCAAFGLWIVTGVACNQTDVAAAAGTGSEDKPRAGEECHGIKDCADGEYCAVPEGECGRAGVCTPMPIECPRDRPVCGCEGVTYDNGACEAALNGDSVDHQGECPPPPCSSNAQCSIDEYCAKATGACESEGACTPTPLQCSNVYSPVCGCNGVTYGNACKAAKAGVTVGKLGAC